MPMNLESITEGVRQERIIAKSAERLAALISGKEEIALRGFDDSLATAVSRIRLESIPKVLCALFELRIPDTPVEQIVRRRKAIRNALMQRWYSENRIVDAERLTDIYVERLLNAFQNDWNSPAGALLSRLCPKVHYLPELASSVLERLRPYRSTLQGYSASSALDSLCEHLEAIHASGSDTADPLFDAENPSTQDIPTAPMITTAA